MKDPRRLERFQRWMAVFEGTAGQSVLADLRKMCGQDSTSVAQSMIDGKLDPYYTVLKEGRRSIWLDIQAALTDPPELPEEEDDELAT